MGDHVVHDSLTNLNGATSLLGTDMETVQDKTQNQTATEDATVFSGSLTAGSISATNLQLQDCDVYTAIGTMQSDITTAEGNISTLQSDVTTAEGNISTLQSDVATVTGSISSIVNKTQNQTATSGATTFSGDVTFVKPITGYNTALTPTVGQVGYIVSSFTSGDIAAVSGQLTNITSVTLGTGTWLVTGLVRVWNSTTQTTSTVSSNNINFGIFEASNTPSGTFDSYNKAHSGYCKDVTNASGVFSIAASPGFEVTHIVNLTQSKSFYLNAQIAYSGGSIKFKSSWCGITAVRIA